MVGNGPAIRKLRAWAQAWVDGSGSPPSVRAAMLEGPPGVGKTTAALALASDLGWSLVEMNASDARNQDAIAAVAGRASVTNTLGDSGEYVGTRGGGRTLILLDEADCLTGRATEGASARPAALNLREFLRGRYGSVDALASAWGLGGPGAPPAFAEWSSVPATGGRGAWTRLAAAQRDLSDWRSVGRPKDSSDRGGLGAIARLVRETRQPLLLTVNDPTSLTRYSPVFRQGVVRLRFFPLDPMDLRAHLERVARQERYEVPAAILATIVERSQGDLRAALTDLEAVAIRPDAVTAATLFGARDLPSDFYAFTSDVFAHPRFYRSVEIRNRLDVTPDDLLPWMEENLPRAAPSARRRYEAFEILARAEQYLAWARRARVWSLWSYASELMTGGVSTELAADGPARSPQLSFPQFLGAMGRTRFVRATRQSILGKVGGRLHLSRRKAGDAYLPFLERLFRGPGTMERGPALLALRRTIARELRLTPEELALLLGSEPESAAVRSLAPPEPATSTAPTAEPDPAPADDPPATSPPLPKGRRPKVQRKLAEF